jgi:hypothetical protein
MVKCVTAFWNVACAEGASGVTAPVGLNGSLPPRNFAQIVGREAWIALRLAPRLESPSGEFQGKGGCNVLRDGHCSLLRRCCSASKTRR